MDEQALASLKAFIEGYAEEAVCIANMVSVDPRVFEQCRGKEQAARAILAKIEQWEQTQPSVEVPQW